MSGVKSSPFLVSKTPRTRSPPPHLTIGKVPAVSKRQNQMILPIEIVLIQHINPLLTSYSIFLCQPPCILHQQVCFFLYIENQQLFYRDGAVK